MDDILKNLASIASGLLVAAICGSVAWLFRSIGKLRDDNDKLKDTLTKTEQTLTASINELRVTDAKQELKIDTCWTVITDNAKLHATRQGYGKMNSPLVINDRTREMFRQAGMTAPLQEFYRTEGKFLHPVDMEMEIARRFRRDLIKNVCMVHDMQDAQCLALAIEIAKEAVEVPYAPPALVGIPALA